MRAMVRWSLAAVLGLAVSACGGKGDALAEVGGEAVSKEEFEAYLKFKRLPVGGQDAKRYDAALDQYLERMALAEAVDEAIEDGKVVDAALLQAELHEFRREALISRYFERFLADAVTDEAVTNYYNTHADEYSENRVHVAHVLLRTSRAMSEPERAVKRTKAQEAISKIRAGEDFAKVAEAYSEDTLSAKKGGDLGWIQQGAIDAKLSETAFSLPVGHVSEPFETQFGWHILKVLEAPQQRQRPLEAVKGDIRYRLRSEAKDAELKRLLAGVSIEKR